MLIRLGHSPDPDDAFMFWGLASGEVDPRGFEFEHVLKDIQTLNEWALEGRLEVTAISLHAYPHVQDKYVLLPHGASMGSGYGPIVVAREELSEDDLRRVEIAVPGRMTTAFLTLKLKLGDFSFREVPFDEIMDEVSSGKADAGLLIHEGPAHLRHCRLEEDRRSRRVVARRDRTAVAARRERRAARPWAGRAPRAVRLCWPSRSASGLENRERALEYALQFGRGLDDELADRFVGMYVNELTEDYGEDGRRAVRELLRRGEEIGAFTEPVRVEFVS